MRNISFKRPLLICLICLCVMTKPIMAEERNIYIGDLITLDIKSQAVDEEALREALTAFDVVDIKETNEGYQVTIRSFEPGDTTIAIGNQDITIAIASTLEDMPRDDIFEGDLTPRDDGKSVPWFILYMVIIGVFVLSGCILLIGKLRNRQAKELPPYERFKSALEAVDISTASALVEMTAILKGYMEVVFQCKIIGKTSGEIMMEIQYIESTKPYQRIVKQWLNQCDTYKFSGVQVNEDQVEQLRLELIQIGVSIHEKEEVVI
ncbi:hypothetical protein HZI73_08575 [Vallitalea pronyensis]|uniref:Uncharacterized protein n=1 Tax=Vallitalea pronyensis TaxID=1348613 RepID=A0A8J8MJ13_9FIRM|nr:hypothetical protein [Vallitalea pronyensis]QUI22351.1 hypothetical protein HZI73_08575 [Vallitalea pronyensis]